MNHLDRYQSLLEGYLQGIHTGREVVGQAFDMLIEGTDREALWQALTPEHRDEITQYLQNYDEAAPPLLALVRRAVIAPTELLFGASRRRVNMTSLIAYRSLRPVVHASTAASAGSAPCG